ncbi:TnpA family transposase [Novosphingobium chloroacetimidivorans]|uniref:TnpA family transposase n=1 Tax=Novosphingobium chloroacetimidivorans TaxID=1428314 RepID=A0A7W7KE82_9SPHN|nr:TnpA family transposase [Novosphingobium chloroacetimidivorans]
MLRKSPGYLRQNSVERALFMLDWPDDVELRWRTIADLNKGEAHDALARYS